VWVLNTILYNRVYGVFIDAVVFCDDVTYVYGSYRKLLYVIRDLVSSNNNSIADCIFYLTKKGNQLEDGS